MKKENICFKCKNHIDKSDPNITWVSINRHWFMFKGARIPTKKILLCSVCGLELLQHGGY